MRTIGKVLLGALLVLVLTVIVAHFAWKYSGSGKWEKVASRKGVTIYSMKTPGSTIEKFKGVWKLKGRLSSFVMWASDTNDDSMTKETGLYGHRVLQPGVRRSASTWKQPLTSFLDPREFVIKAEFTQDPKTHAILYEVTGVPDMIPPDDCCVRIPVMANRWTLTPLKSGEVMVEWYVNMDIGGAVPYALQNKVQPDGMLNFAPKVQRFINKEKFRNARYDWVVEPNS
jgi:hypothetical protein